MDEEGFVGPTYQSNKGVGSPLVSVCITTYQHVEFIRQCIEGALMQKTSFPFEIIIGEDESDDGTRDICIKYAKEYPQLIRLFLRSREDVIYVNGYPTGRFNFISNIKSARGKYIALCEGDDFWTDPHKLQKQVEFLESNLDCVACHHWQEILTLGKNGMYQRRPAPKDGHGYLSNPKANVDAIFANHLRVKLRTVMFRNVVSEFPDWFYKVHYGDVPFSMILGKYGSYGFINQVMAVYRVTNKGVSTAGMESEWFTYYHFTEWIRIWELANQYYNYEYNKNAVQTIVYFYETILKRYRNSGVLLRLTEMALFRSKLNLPSRFCVFVRIIHNYSLMKLKRIYKLFSAKQIDNTQKK